MRRLKESGERLSVIKGEGEMPGKTLKEISFQFQRNVYGKKKSANKTTGIQEDMRN